MVLHTRTRSAQMGFQRWPRCDPEVGVRGASLQTRGRSDLRARGAREPATQGRGRTGGVGLQSSALGEGTARRGTARGGTARERRTAQLVGRTARLVGRTAQLVERTARMRRTARSRRTAHSGRTARVHGCTAPVRLMRRTAPRSGLAGSSLVRTALEGKPGAQWCLAPWAQHGSRWRCRAWPGRLPVRRGSGPCFSASSRAPRAGGLRL